MNILVACEYSGRVRQAFRDLGHHAVSCDIVKSADDSEYHIMNDVRLVMKHTSWDLVIAFPPCTHLCSSGARHWKDKRKDGRQQSGIDFFLDFTRLSCPWAIENPVGIMSTVFRKPDQIIQPYQFGDSAKKSTCLWLNQLPKLVSTACVDMGSLVVNPDGRRFPQWMTTKGNHRNVTFQGIARAMAAQWGVVP